MLDGEPHLPYPVFSRRTPEPVIDSLALKEIASSVPEGSRWPGYQPAGRALDQIPVDAIPDDLRARIAVLGSFTLEPFLSVLRVEGARVGLWVDAYLGGYGQYRTELLSPDSALYRFRPHVTFVEPFV